MALGASTFIVGIINVASKPILYDESITLYLATVPWARLLELFWSNAPYHEPAANMSGYIAVMHPWLKLGDSEFLLRLPSVICAALTVPVAYLIARRLFDERVALLTGALLAVNTFLLQYAQEARAYAALVLVVSLCTYLFIRATDDGRWRTWVSYGVLGAVATYLHVFGVLVLVAHVATFAVRRPSRPRRALAAYSLVLGLVSPLLIAVVIQAGRFGGPGIPLSLHGIVSLISRLAGGGPPQPGLRIIVVVYVLLQAVGLWAIARRWGDPDRRWSGVVLLAWLLIPICAIVALTVVKDVFVLRYFIVSLPPFAMLAALGLTQLRWRFVVASIVLLLGAQRVVTWYGFRSGRPDYKSAATSVDSALMRDDEIVFFPAFSSRPFDYYSARFDPSQKIRQPTGSSERLWLVVANASTDHPSRALTQLITNIESRYAETDQLRFDRVEIRLYERFSGTASEGRVR